MIETMVLNTVIVENITFGGFIRPIYGVPLDIGVFIDMDKKICRFYNYEKKSILTKGKILSDSVRICGWIKGNPGSFNSKDRGMIILNEGCIPIPDWIKV